MKQSDRFIQICLRLCKQYEGQSVDYDAVEQEILLAGKRLPTHVHPMIAKICTLADGINKSYIEGADKRETWEHICQTAKDYADNKWEPTIWTLMAVYSEEQDNRAVASVSVRIDRTLGKRTIQTSVSVLHETIVNLTNELNDDQSDE